MSPTGPEPSRGARPVETGSDEHSRQELLSFLASLGAALGAIGETVGAVQLRLADVARAYGLHDARAA